jgi:hypothetical protein
VIRLSFDIELKYEIAEQPADFVFNIHAAETSLQSVVNEVLTIDPPCEHRLQTDESLGNRYLRLRARPGPLSVRYGATVDIDHHRQSAALLEEVPIARIPPQVLPFIYPEPVLRSGPPAALRRPRVRAPASRLLARAGDPRLGAATDRVHAGNDEQQLVRDGHAGRAGRRVPGLRPPDDRALPGRQHSRALREAASTTARRCSSGRPISMRTSRRSWAIVWYLFDPTGITAPMGLVRIGTGRDAADVSLGTIFGAVRSHPPIIAVAALDDAARGFHLPQHSVYALSTTTAMPAEAA